MNLSMYTAAIGAKAQQDRLGIVANNLSNLQTEGYKTQTAGFADLLYDNYYRGATSDPGIGSGTRIEKTDFNFETGTHIPTQGKYDFAIVGNGLFAVYDPMSEQTYFTRNGHFHLSNFYDDVFYLADQNGGLVLDPDMAFIPMMEGYGSDESLNVGVFSFANQEGFIAMGNNYYQPAEKNGAPYVLQDAVLRRGYLEGSNVDLPQQFTQIIESQRAYQMSLKMIHTTDEIEQTINTLR